MDIISQSILFDVLTKFTSIEVQEVYRKFNGESQGVLKRSTTYLEM